ncbi:IspD/TarI family cytidylyltransferase [Ureaplasma ceti]|uniref:2-C-methyl-D-erythritol 4-phosphate cytidylyltransferase n=1 Tax=Ureaplasma ceti TaxID=3119530 RepID=A0ABP9U7P8_9BACT
MKYTVIIPAAGSSSRFQKDKLLIKLNNELLIKHTIYNFQYDKDCEKIILVVQSNKFNFYKSMFRLINKLLVVEGDSSRSESVYKGLQYALKQENVLIHDADRPFVSLDLITDVKNALENHNLVTSYIPVYDSLVKTDANGVTYVDRQEYKLIQTPQGAKVDMLIKAYDANKTNTIPFNDEISLILNHFPEEPVEFVLGSSQNKKITTPDDVSQIEYDSL